MAKEASVLRSLKKIKQAKHPGRRHILPIRLTNVTCPSTACDFPIFATKSQIRLPSIAE